MRQPSEYTGFYTDCYQKARELTQKLSQAGHHTESKVFSFLEKHCFFGYPGDEVGNFIVGQWLSKPGRPLVQIQGVAWIMCFSNDVPPIERPSIGDIQPAVFIRQSQTIVMFDVDIWSTLELAIFFMHEGYHAWHHLGEKLDGVASGDTDITQETNAWLISINLLQVAGGRTWAEVVREEIQKLRGIKLTKTKGKPNSIPFKESTTDWPAFDGIFCPTSNEAVKRNRRVFASLHAHMIYWSRQGVRAVDVCHAFVTRLYKKE